MQHRVQIERPWVQAHLAGFHLGEIQNVIEQAQQGARGAIRLHDVVVLLCVQGCALQQFEHAQNSVHRRADFVAHVGQELTLGDAGLLGPGLRLDVIGDVGIGAYKAAVWQGRGLDLQCASGRRAPGIQCRRCNTAAAGSRAQIVPCRCFHQGVVVAEVPPVGLKGHDFCHVGVVQMLGNLQQIHDPYALKHHGVVGRNHGYALRNIVQHGLQMCGARRQHGVGRLALLLSMFACRDVGANRNVFAGIAVLGQHRDHGGVNPVKFAIALLAADFAAPDLAGKQGLPDIVKK